MDTPTGPRLSRDLSPRQREVAALIAEGKTNGEIAEELGISLQGAKYHVSELLRALDLDTREEVAEWWRQQRGMRARFAVTARWSRMPALVKWGLGGAAAAGVVVVAVLALLLAVGPDDGDGGLAPGVWVVVPEPSEADAAVANIRVKSAAGDDLVVAEVASPAMPAFSPGGTMVAVVSGDESVRVVTTAGDAVWEEADSGARTFAAPVWAPDAARFAYGRIDGVSIASSDGGTTAAFDGGWAPPGIIEPWSPDSRHLLLTMPPTADAALVVLARDGTVHSSAEASVWDEGFASFPGATGDWLQPPTTRWLDEQTFEVWFIQFGPGVPDGSAGYVATGTIGGTGELSWDFSEADASWLIESAIQRVPLPRWLLESAEYPGAMALGPTQTMSDGTTAALIRYREDGEPPQQLESPDIKTAIVAMVDGELREIAVVPDPGWLQATGVVAPWDVLVVR